MYTKCYTQDAHIAEVEKTVACIDYSMCIWLQRVWTVDSVTKTSVSCCVLQTKSDEETRQITFEEYIGCN
jgi:hypothetical protein